MPSRNSQSDAGRSQENKLPYRVVTRVGECLEQPESRGQQHQFGDQEKTGKVLTELSLEGK